MEAALQVTRDEFIGAIRCGDLAVINSYFAQPHVKAEVAEIEALLVDGEYTASLPVSVGGSSTCPWYRQYSPVVPWLSPLLVLELSVMEDHVHVLQWFLSPPRIAEMPGTLQRVVPTLAVAAAVSHSCEIIELLFAPHVVGVFLSHHSHQKLLNDLLQWTARSSDLFQLLLAHGANMNQETEITPWPSFSDPASIDRVAADGAFLVGAEVLYYPISVGNIAPARRLLEYGIDRNDSNVGLLHKAIDHKCVEALRLLIDEGFADADQRFNSSGTPPQLSRQCARCFRKLMTTGSPSSMTCLES